MSARSERTDRQTTFGNLRKILASAAAGGVAIAVLLLLLVFHHSAIPIVRADPVLAGQLRAQIDQASHSATNDTPKIVSATESEVNSLIRSQLAAYQATRQSTAVRDVEVHLVNDLIGVHIAVAAYGQAMTMDVAGTLRTEDGFIRFDPVSGKIGALPIPASALKSAVRQAMASSQSQNDMRLPANLKDLRVEGGRLIATYN